MATYTGKSTRDVIYGTSSADTMRGNGGDDYLNGNGGNDLIEGGDGADKLDGNTGNDTLRGGLGIDAIFGGAGNDLSYGDDGNDYIWDLSGLDKMYGGIGDDRLVASRTAVSMDGSSGNDVLVVEASNTTVKGTENLIVAGGTEVDTLHLIANKTSMIIPDPYFGADPVHARAWVGFSSTGAGGFGVISPEDKSEYIFSIGSGTFTGIEKVTIDPLTQMRYSGSNSATAVTVTGGNQGDYYQGGKGNETFVLGNGHDTFDFSNGGADFGSTFRAHGTDRIVNFDPAEDIIMFRWGGGTHQDGDVSIVEKNGHTILTSKVDSTVFHTLDIDKVGIQDSIIYDWIPA